MVRAQFLSGVVEGFYGRPWTLGQRCRLFAWMQSWGLNTYLYAPKDDLKHRNLWREPYSVSEVAELETLIRDCQRRGITFIYAIAPGLDADYWTKDGVAALQSKATQLLSLGCGSFALLFDDIVSAPSSGMLGATGVDAAQQAKVANEFLTFLRGKAKQARLLFCPTPYCERMSGPVWESDYLKKIGAELDRKILILWTGPEIISETIAPKSIRELARVLHRKPLIWDNLHANDYDLRRIYLGPYSGRPLELRNEVAGVLSNPNCEFEANFVPLRTLALWAQAKEKWEPREAYLAALREWLPAWSTAISSPGSLFGKVGIDDLVSLGDSLYLPFEHGSRANELLVEFQHLLRTPPPSWGHDMDRFYILYSHIELLFRRMTELENRELLHTFYRHVWELKEEAHLLLNYLKWLQSKPGLNDTFASAEHRPKTYRGGLVAELQRLLPMDAAGVFNHRPPLFPKHDPNPYR